MLAMARKIMRWLVVNEAQLQDIDYADGVDHPDDVELRVWSNAHRHKARKKARNEIMDSLLAPLSNLKLQPSANPTHHVTTAQSVTYLHFAAVVSPEQRHKPKCWYCADRHIIRSCPNFLALSRNKKLAVVRDRKLCYRCLNKGHGANHCRSWVKCDACGRRHLTAMHRYKEDTAA